MRWFLVLGGIGLVGFIAEMIDDRFPDALLLAAFLSCIVAMYGVIILRGRRRGEGVLDSLEIRYASRLTTFERAFWLLLGGALIVLSMPMGRVPISWSSLLLGAFALFVGASGRPPFGGASTNTSRPDSD